jgi:O-acetyl-ADP-ribose deacetylase (regulator of RNase III)
MYNIKVARGNVVNAAVEAIVTPANNNLMPGQGISKMVFYSAGKKLVEACSRLKYCETGCTVVTSGYNLPAQYIIHAVGPWWHGGFAGEAEKLASTYLSIMRDVRKLNIQSVAIPAICTGIGGYPAEEAANIAIASVVSYLQSHNMNTEVLFMCYDVDTLYTYRSKLNEGTEDVSKFFGRSEIKFTTRLNDAENKLLKKKLFKKEVEPEKIQECVTSVLKRQIKKKYPECTILLNRKNEQISQKTVDKYNKSGPFITADSLQEYEFVDGGKIKMRLLPYTFLDTKEELECKSIAQEDNNENGVPDKYENGVTPSFEEKQKITTVNVEQLLYGDKRKNAEETTRLAPFENDSYVNAPVSSNDETTVGRRIEESNQMFINLSAEESEQMDYMYEMTRQHSEYNEYNGYFEEEVVETPVVEPNVQYVQSAEIPSGVVVSDAIAQGAAQAVAQTPIATQTTTQNVASTVAKGHTKREQAKETLIAKSKEKTPIKNMEAEIKSLGIIFSDDDHIGMPLDEFPKPNAPLYKKHRSKSKYWPDFTPNYKDRAYQKQLHSKNNA